MKTSRSTSLCPRPSSLQVEGLNSRPTPHNLNKDDFNEADFFFISWKCGWIQFLQWQIHSAYTQPINSKASLWWSCIAREKNLGNNTIQSTIKTEWIANWLEAMVAAKAHKKHRQYVDYFMICEEFFLYTALCIMHECVCVCVCGNKHRIRRKW